MLHILLIALHALGGLVALTAGLTVLRPTEAEPPPAFRLYLGGLWAMVLSLAAVVALDFPTLDPASRVTFGALTVFAMYIGWRGWSARRQVHERPSGWRRRYTDDVGFTLIALFTGFVVIAVLDLGAPIWLVVATGVLAVLGGRTGLGQAERRLAA
jgi:hypothetical protein